MIRFLICALVFLSACARGPRPEPPRRVLDDYFPGDRTLPWHIVGRSFEGRPIYAVDFGKGPDLTLIVGGIHGDEKTSIAVALKLCDELPRMSRLMDGHRVVVIPILNPDGFVYGTRTNAEGVDLNRNFPAINWGMGPRDPRYFPGLSSGSEPETRAAVALVERRRPSKIIALHDPLTVNNFDGRQSEGLARAMSIHNRHPVTGSIGYPTPGSFGTWAGVERFIPMVTLETPAGDPEKVWNANRWALAAAIRYRVVPRGS